MRNGPLSGVKRTLRGRASMSATDPKGTYPKGGHERHRSLRVGDLDRKLFNGPEPRPLPPANRSWRHGQLQLGPALEKPLQRALALTAGELVASAEMYASADR